MPHQPIRGKPPVSQLEKKHELITKKEQLELETAITRLASLRFGSFDSQSKGGVK